MIPAPDPHGQAAPTPRDSPARLPAGPCPLGARRTGDAIVGVIGAMRKIAGAGGDAAVSLASIPPPRVPAPGPAVALPLAAA